MTNHEKIFLGQGLLVILFWFRVDDVVHGWEFWPEDVWGRVAGLGVFTFLMVAVPLLLGYDRKTKQFPWITRWEARNQEPN